MNAEDKLQRLLSTIGASVWEGDIVASCPVCQSDEEEVDKFKMVILPGSKSRVAVCFCRRCCNSEYQFERKKWWNKVVAFYAFTEEDFAATKEEAEEAWKNIHLNHYSDKVAPAAIETLDAVYTDLLQLLSLSDYHKKWLQKRGVDPEWAFANGYRSTEGVRVSGKFEWADLKSSRLLPLWKKYREKLKLVPGFSDISDIHSDRGKIGLRKDALLTPSRDYSGRIQAVKQRMTDGKGSRMRWLASFGSGTAAVVNAPHWPVGVGNQQWQELWITEGERKADCHWLLTKKATVGVTGVGCWRQLEQIVTRGLGSGGTVVVAFDQDAAGEATATKVTDWLQKRKIGCLRASWSEKKGIDDALVAGIEISTKSTVAAVSEANSPPPHTLPLCKVLLSEESAVLDWLSANGPALRDSVPAKMGVVAKLINRKRVRCSYCKEGQILEAV